jgi:hypothetical protein
MTGVHEDVEVSTITLPVGVSFRVSGPFVEMPLGVAVLRFAELQRALICAMIAGSSSSSVTLLVLACGALPPTDLSVT